MSCRIPVLSLLSIFLFVGGMCPRAAFSNAAFDHPLENVDAGHVLLKADDGSRQHALHMGSEVSFTVNGLVSHVELTQTFTNQTDDWQEAIYVLPMSDTAAVNEMEMRIGDRVVKATIQEKNAARKIYTAAKREGKKAALVEQSRPNLFQQAIANIAPREKIVIHLKYVEQVNYDQGEFSFRFPMTLTPRFIPAGGPPRTDAESDRVLSPNTKGWALPTAEVPDAHLITPPMTDNITNPIRIHVSLDPGLELSEIGSLYHNVSVKRKDERYQVSLVDNEVPMDRDFVLSWRPIIGSAPEAALFKEQIEGDDYVLLMVVPPEQSHSGGVLPRDMIFVIDTSGSMRGTSIEQAKASLIRALDQLRPQDRFNIVEFNSTWSRLYQEPQYPDNFNLPQAKEWVNRLSAGGGTNMLPALQTALSMRGEENQLKHIVFITDGAVGNEDSLFKLIHDQLGDTRLFPVSIGSAPNSFFMRQAAKHGRGTFTHIGSTNEVSDKMNGLFAKIDSPVATDIHIEWPTTVESYPKKIPAVYRGEPLLIVAKADHLNGEVHVNGATAQLPWRRSLSLGNVTSQPGVGSLWARRKIETLEDERVAGKDPAIVRSQTIEVALAHKLVSKFTSLVAVEEVVSRKPEEPLKKSAVPNKIAAGQVAQYPKTATNSPLYYLIAMLAGLAGLLLQRRSYS